MNGYSFRGGDVIVIQTFFLLNGASYMKVKSFLVFCFKGTKSFNQEWASFEGVHLSVNQQDVMS